MDRASSSVEFGFQLAPPRPSLNEPIWIHFVATNRGTENLTMDLGLNGIEAFEITTTDPRGRILEGSQGDSNGGFGCAGDITLGPGATHRQRLLVNRWHPFDIPGTYRIRIRLMPLSSGSGRVPIASADFVLRVFDRDELALRRICADLAATALETSDVESASEAASALAHVTDEIAIPYLEKLVERAGSVAAHAIEGLGRIRGPRAVDLLNRIAAGDTEAAVLARRQVSSMRIER